MKKESTIKRYAEIRKCYDQYKKAGWKPGRIIDKLCMLYGLSFRTIARYCGLR